MDRNSESGVLKCPFCGGPVEEAVEMVGRFGNTFSGGKCQCGAIYVFDQSGHNLGDAYVDALALAYEGDLDKAWSMSPEEDYSVKELTYDKRRNRLTAEAPGRGKPMATYMFIKVKA